MSHLNEANTFAILFTEISREIIIINLVIPQMFDDAYRKFKR